MSSRAEQKGDLREQRKAANRAGAEAAERRRRTAYLLGGICVIALVLVVGLVLVSQAADEATSVDSVALFGGIEQDGIALGDPGAPVTVVEFADLQCPYCGRFATEDLPAIVEEYVKPGDVRLELRLLDFIGADSTRGALVAGAVAEQDRIWPFAENVYSHQEAENSGYMTTDFLRSQAEGVAGLDAAEAVADSTGEAPQRYLDEARSQAAEAGVDSTPSFLVGPTGGETQLVGAGDLEGAIDEALARAGE